ncbi:RNA polymerase sigma factor [Dyadobacter psychrotolerans]|uniref:Sigma-70 family RNA polymerase sigma factor n=1 Tax=Dyadobacter psychrotolerans TaxID=2541721 RepID=A0A4R5DUT9_9BACT|nr:sigma-70 family RNA polymerase sigma factor [Dyadobacter psychrotolerans]TDE17557.1 sigma-70 family RNA polymerase sigma factor [Dyadobacter psychrotolerans]
MEEKFLKILKENQNILHKISRLYRDSHDDQQDLFQEIVYQLWKSFPAFRGDAKISTWIYRVALNTAIASFRKAKISTDHFDSIPEQLQHNDNSGISENEERLFAALRKLNDSEKAIISLFLEDYSYQEIATITGITENYVGVKINRIKEKLKMIINK